MCDCVCLFLSWLIERPLRALPQQLVAAGRCRHGRVMELAAAPSNDALRPGMARALDGRNGRIKEAARDGGSRALHAVASHGKMSVFVDGLAWKMSKEGVRDQFELFGEILEAVVIANKGTDISKGRGFVTFWEAEAAIRACLGPYR
ncbi:RNA-binding protein 24 [Triticum urartu]|uniref:RNA-binding protein 24 n=1 Tax=Triticum urartu TaxID=4572 RepID=M8ADT6_TRIUA|nr:RNA-binding protein 24 [Triticum urartu]